MRERSVALVLALLTVVLCLSTACGANGPGKGAEIKAADGTLQCKVPDGWQDVSGKLNNKASLEVADLKSDRYMIAIPELKYDLDADLTLEGYSKIIVDNVLKTAKDAKIIGTEKTQVGGNDALLTKISASVENVKIMYWICCVEFPDKYTQILGWTLAGKEKKSEKTIRAVIDSVAEQVNSHGTEPKEQ